MTEQIQKIVEFKTCPICGSEFLPNKSRRQIYCSMSCLKKSYYKPSTKIQNPIGIIQNIIVNFTSHTEGNFGNTSHDNLIWFLLEHKIGCLNLDVLKNRNFKVSDILLFNGYDLQDSEAFDKEFAILIKNL